VSLSYCRATEAWAKFLRRVSGFMSPDRTVSEEHVLHFGGGSIKRQYWRIETSHNPNPEILNSVRQKKPIRQQTSTGAPDSSRHLISKKTNGHPPAPTKVILQSTKPPLHNRRRKKQHWTRKTRNGTRLTN